jgi:hypothetical protein
MLVARPSIVLIVSAADIRDNLVLRKRLYRDE